MKHTDFVTKETNPVIKADYPGPDVIRAGDVYYMLSATLHFLPGGAILRSYDLIRWEIAGYVFGSFDGREETRMTNERNYYGGGMGPGCIRYHNGRFYVSFADRETGRTYFFWADRVEGPWRSGHIDCYFHHGSLFFDEDDRVYLIYGYNEIRIAELLPDFSGVKPEGFARTLIEEKEDVWLGYEGTHFYRIRGKYYLFTVHWPKSGTARKTQLCFWADSLDGEFQGGTVLDDDLDFCNNGVAEGGLVETNGGSWYALLSQDRGAAGRSPVLVPVEWEGDRPVFGKGGEVPRTVKAQSNRPYYEYESLYCSDDFSYRTDDAGHCTFRKPWQWNHEPDPELWKVSGGVFRIKTGKVCVNVTQAANTLTQRLFFPRCNVRLTVDATDLNDGDFAGLCALQGCYSMLAVTKELHRYYLVRLERKQTEKNKNSKISDYMPARITEKISLVTPIVRLKLEADFARGADTVFFSYREPREGGKWRRVGEGYRLHFGLDHFAGARCGLAVFATKKAGGSAAFRNFVYECEEGNGV
ncbi:MAG: glycoside hydrolase 43 family protein [Roseburia sp.]|nr:glycoside hydrolase 43 family protein [Roseburia sp.]MCM1097097.1 glycoside hydrolase 43 family protein [Ruminococcus flavefaciens]